MRKITNVNSKNNPKTRYHQDFSVILKTLDLMIFIMNVEGHILMKKSQQFV